MSGFWPPLSADSVEYMQTIFKKTTYHAKVDPIDRIHVINAIDNGKSKADVAREYGVHPQTIAYIYKQKDVLLKNYKKKFDVSLKDVQYMNLEILLLNWFKTQIKNGVTITEELLKSKAREILTPVEGKFEDIDNWLEEFEVRHNIIKYLNSDVNVPSKKEWLEAVDGYHEDDVYVGSTFALMHKLDVETYLSGYKPDTYISTLFVCNTSGLDKKELLVVGQDALEDVTYIRSLPLKYYRQYQSCVLSFVTVLEYLKTWDAELKSANRNIALILNVPEPFLQNFHFDNIKVINLTKSEYLRNNLDKIVQYFKYHFRKLQITKGFLYPNERNDMMLISLLNVVSSAWHNVTTKFIRNLFHPPQEGSLLLYDLVHEYLLELNHSLSDWSRSSNLPLMPQAHSVLDNFVQCDKDIVSTLYDIDSKEDAINELGQHEFIASTSGIDAFQAMKRLYTYLQREGAPPAVLESAQTVETDLELGAVAEIYRYHNDNSTNDTQNPE